MMKVKRSDLLISFYLVIEMFADATFIERLIMVWELVIIPSRTLKKIKQNPEIKIATRNVEVQE